MFNDCVYLYFKKESSVSSDKVTRLLEASSARLRDQGKERLVSISDLLVT